MQLHSIPKSSETMTDFPNCWLRFCRYAFGNLLALSLFQRYKKEGKSFVPTYIEILSAGGTKKTEKLLRESGIDITKPKFWQDGFDYIQDQVSELSKLN